MMWLDLTHPSWNPFSELRRVQDQMNQVFGGHPSGASSYPAVNLWGNDDKLVLTAEIPGLDANDVNITVQGNQVSLEGAKKTETADEKAVYYRRERGSGQFSRSFRLPFEIDENKVAAKFANGVLSVTLPRAESAKPKKITISS